MAVYIYNRTPHKLLDFRTLYKAKNGKRPNISHIRIFGSKAYRLATQPKKLDPRGNPYYLVGYQAHNVLKLLDPRTGKVTVSRDVVIHEGVFYKDKDEDLNLGKDLEIELLDL